MLPGIRQTTRGWTGEGISLILSGRVDWAWILEYMRYGQAFGLLHRSLHQEGYQDDRRKDHPGARLRDEPGREVDLPDAAENGGAGRRI